jgi:hypothetical protein
VLEKRVMIDAVHLMLMLSSHKNGNLEVAREMVESKKKKQHQ